MQIEKKQELTNEFEECLNLQKTRNDERDAQSREELPSEGRFAPQEETGNKRKM